MHRNQSKFKRLRLCVWLALTLFLLLNCTFRFALGTVNDFMRVQSNNSCILPSIILQNGTDNVSLVYESQTSAKITINATTEPTTYNYTLNILNNASENCEAQLELYDNANITRIANATIILHDNSTSLNQIIISNGDATQSSGDFYSLNGSSTIYIKVKDLKQSQDGSCFLHVYLRVRLNDTSVYTLYTITFELT